MIKQLSNLNRGEKHHEINYNTKEIDGKFV